MSTAQFYHTVAENLGRYKITNILVITSKMAAK